MLGLRAASIAWVLQGHLCCQASCHQQAWSPTTLSGLQPTESVTQSACWNWDFIHGPLQQNLLKSSGVGVGQLELSCSGVWLKQRLMPGSNLRLHLVDCTARRCFLHLNVATIWLTVSCFVLVCSCAMSYANDCKESEVLRQDLSTLLNISVTPAMFHEQNQTIYLTTQACSICSLR